MLVLLAALIACAPAVDTAAPVAACPDAPTPTRTYYVRPGTIAEIDTAGRAFTVELADDFEVVSLASDGHLCSMRDGVVVDVNGDGRCDLSPDVTLRIDVW